MNTSVFWDTLWILIATLLLFSMNLGAALVEAGFFQAKRSLELVSRYLLVFLMASLGFFSLGWGLMFGNGNNWFGLSGLFFLTGSDNSPAMGSTYRGVYSALAQSGLPLVVKFLYHLMGCLTAAAILARGVSKRITRDAVIWFSLIMAAVIYPVTGRWVWGGGWLAQLGMIDFAGATVIHAGAGWTALAGLWLAGPKYRLIPPGGQIQSFPPGNRADTTIGILAVWFGWLGFNPGAGLITDLDLVIHVLSTINVSALAGIFSATLASRVLLGKIGCGMAFNGGLAGLVAISASCAYVSLTSALIIGFIAGILLVASIFLLDRFKIDDSGGVLSIHLSNGVFSALTVGLFTQNEITGFPTGNGLFFGGGYHLLQIQCAGILATAMYSFVLAACVWAFLQSNWNIRVSLRQEFQELNKHSGL